MSAVSDKALTFIIISVAGIIGSGSVEMGQLNCSAQRFYSFGNFRFTLPMNVTVGYNFGTRSTMFSTKRSVQLEDAIHTEVKNRHRQVAPWLGLQVVFHPSSTSAKRTRYENESDKIHGTQPIKRN